MNEISSIQTTVAISIHWKQGRVIRVESNSRAVNHFLELIRASRAYNTWVNYAHDLKLFFRIVQKSPDEITRADCVRFIHNQAKEGFADSTINRRLAAISSLYTELCLYEPSLYSLNPVNPFNFEKSGIKSNLNLYRRQGKRIPKILSIQDLRLFLSSLRSWRDRSMVMLMWLSCLRISEVVAIRFDDLEYSHRRLTIPMSKNKNARVVFIDQMTLHVLNQYLEKERKLLFSYVEEVFIGFKGKARGKPISINAVQKMIKYYGDKCGVSDVHAHRFRHTGITHLVQQGMSEPAIRKFVGHSSPESLEPYLHLSDEFVAKEFEKAQDAFQLYAGTGISEALRRDQ